MSIVIDANCWCDYVVERLKNETGEAVKVFELATADGGIAIDDQNLMKQQYISMKKPYAEQIFDLWFEELFRSGGLKLVTLKGKDNLFKELKGLGLSKKEHVFFRVAIHGEAKVMISRDSDFFDPAKKKVGEAEKAAFMCSGTGPVCKHMKKNYGVTVYFPQSYIAAKAA